MNQDQDLRRQLVELLRGGNAHIPFDEAVGDFPARLRGSTASGAPHSAWQLLEHMRIAQRDILEFSRNENGGYRELKFPQDYWPGSAAPPDSGSWDRSVHQFREDEKAFEALIEDSARELRRPFPWGEGQTLLREALVLADHNSYHLGQLVFLRKALGDGAGGKG